MLYNIVLKHFPWLKLVGKGNVGWGCNKVVCGYVEQWAMSRSCHVEQPRPALAAWGESQRYVQIWSKGSSGTGSRASQSSRGAQAEAVLAPGRFTAPTKLFQATFSVKKIIWSTDLLLHCSAITLFFKYQGIAARSPVCISYKCIPVRSRTFCYSAAIDFLIDVFLAVRQWCQ